MNVLIACEESQEVCKAFRALGHNAFSCDLKDPSGGHPEWHMMGNVLKVVNGNCKFVTLDLMLHTLEGPWDMIIAFPPCTYLTNAGAVRMRVNGEIQIERYREMKRAASFFRSFLYADCERIAIENPVPMKLANLPAYDQIIQPYYFGDPYKKRTCLWLKNLPKLHPKEMIDPEECRLWVDGGSKDKHGRSRENRGQGFRDPVMRSKTFPGVARAMAEQWGGDRP